jgi:hypothetical protein
LPLISNSHSLRQNLSYLLESIIYINPFPTYLNLIPFIFSIIVHTIHFLIIYFILFFRILFADFSHSLPLIIFDKGESSDRQNFLISNLSFLFSAVMELSPNLFKQEFFIIFHNFRKLKQPIRVRASIKFY